MSGEGEPTSREPRTGADGRGGEASSRFLVTNDDGIHARGLRLLAGAAGELGRVELAAPDREQSASSHSLTMHRPLRVTRSEDGGFVVDGTPTDCVLLAVNELLETVPDFVVSGVNHGPNMGEDVLYSGTVAAAMEGTILGVPSVAISFAGQREEWLRNQDRPLRTLLRTLVSREDFPEETFFNVNIPESHPDDVRGVRVTALGRRVYSDSLTKNSDPQGREYFWIGGGESHWTGREDSDFRAVEAGYISVTPLHLDLTNFRLMEQVRSWSLET